MTKNLKSRIFKRKNDRFLNDITFRSNRGRQPELHVAEGDDPEVYDGDGVVDVLDDDAAKVEKINMRKKKKGNNK